MCCLYSSLLSFFYFSSLAKPKLVLLTRYFSHVRPSSSLIRQFSISLLILGRAMISVFCLDLRSMNFHRICVFQEADEFWDSREALGHSPSVCKGDWLTYSRRETARYALRLWSPDRWILGRLKAGSSRCGEFVWSHQGLLCIALDRSIVLPSFDLLICCLKLYMVFYCIILTRIKFESESRFLFK